MLRTWVLVVMGLSAASFGQALPVGFYPMGVPEGSLQTSPAAMSGDGTRVVGVAVQANELNAPFAWMASSGISLLSMPTGSRLAGISSLSRNGLVAAGSGAAGTEGTGLVRWRLGQPLEFFGRPSGYLTLSSHAISGDGTTFVGHLEGGPGTGSRGPAFRWTEAGGFSLLPAIPGFEAKYSSAQGVTEDGSVVVGYAFNAAGGGPGYRWSQEEGYTTYAGIDHIWGVTDSGTYMTATGAFGPVRLRADGAMVDLDPFDITVGITPRDISGAGDVIVGQAQLPNTAGGIAYIWTESDGGWLLTDYLNRLGISYPSHLSLGNAASVSADGRIITGTGRNALGQIEGFVVVIPSPGPMFGLLCASALSLRRRR